MLDTSTKINRPSLMVRPTAIKPALQPQNHPQIIVIPQSMLASNGIKTVFSITDSQNRQPTVARVIKPSVPLVSKSAETNKAVSLKRPYPQPSPSCSGSDDDSKSETFDEAGAKMRKRANLDHMTMEEKLMRRKLKNRVAAQNARDKKRMKMDDMEVTIKQLQQQNKILAKQNEDLLALNRRLMAENATLKSSQSQTNVLVKEEEPEIPLTPESYRPPLSSTPPLSSDEDDEVLLSTSLPIQAVDTSTVPVSLAGAAAPAVAGRRSPVSHRLRAPAAGTKSMSGRGAGNAQPVSFSHGAGTVGLSLVDVSSQPVAEIFGDDFGDGRPAADVGTLQLAVQKEEQLVASALSARDNLGDLLAASFSERKEDTWRFGGIDEAREDKLSDDLSEQLDSYLLQFDQLESFDNLFPGFGLD